MLKEDDVNATDDDSSDEEGFRCCSVKSNRSPGPKIALPPAPRVTKNSLEAVDDDDVIG